MAFLQIITDNIFPLLAFVLIGYLMDRTFHLDIASLTKLTFYIVLPCFIFYSIYCAKLDINLLNVFLFCCVQMGILGAVGAVIGKLRGWPAGKTEAFKNGTMFSNNGNIGVALIALIFTNAPFLVGGSADLGPSNKTELKPFGWVSADDFSGRNFHWGIRELGMSAIVNGLVAHGGYRAFGATFAVFSDYCKPAMRLAAIMNLPSMWVFSHDSFYVGEDGPTHEPVEQLAMLRTTPNLFTFRPADANETGACWLAMLRRKDGPSCLFTSRQNLPVLEGVTPENVAKGAYVIWQSSPMPDVLFLATGSEVSLCIEAAKRLLETGRHSRVVSMPCRELFERQSLGYRESVLPGTCAKRVIVEAGVRFGWNRYEVNSATTRFVTLDTFGASAPYKVLAEQFGFTVDNVYAQARGMLN